jgi:FixJ family two-component response regulator
MSNHLQNSPSVFVVDDDKQFLDSLVVLLEALGFTVRGFGGPQSFLQYYRAEMPGCLVLDIRMPRQSGLQMCEQLVRENKRLPVIFVTAHADVTTAVAAMKSGAVEFLEKPFDRGTLFQRVKKALAVDAEWRRQNAYYAAIADRIAQLSDRDKETLTLIQAGESNKSMAAKLYLTERAVEMRRSTLMRKLHVNSLAQLLELATTHRILTEQRYSPEGHSNSRQ